MPASATAASPGEAIANQGFQLAQREFQRVQELVNLGALPRVRLEQAQMDLDDARDEATIEHTLYAPPSRQAGSAASDEVVAAAERRVDREQKRLDHAHQIVDAGVAAIATLQPLEQELTFRETTLNLVRLHARLAEEAEAMKNAPIVAARPQAPIDDSVLEASGMEHYLGDGVFNESSELAPIESAFANRFDRPLPISANGETDVHRELGLDHRGRVDVAVNPTQPEGIWLREYLQRHNIPYYAFTHAMAGKATGAQIHIGPGSTRLSNVDLSAVRPAVHGHTAD